MDIEQVIENICRMPRDNNQPGGKSMFALLRDSGYYEFRDQIGEAEIFNYIQHRKDIVVDWIKMSQKDMAHSHDLYYYTGQSIGYLTKDDKRMSQSHYDTKEKACAAFIKIRCETLIRV